jgi:DNA polymerase V
MFASCELAFRPDLRGRPVVTLSSNDGCVIARSPAAKDLGIKMAQPYHQVRHFERTKGLVAFSANFALYTDMSQRIVSILERFSPDVSPYSIDESFLKFPVLQGMDLEALGNDICSTILQQTGIGTGVGISTTKTLAKQANGAAKKYPATGGVVDLFSDPGRRERLLAITEVGDVWGVGKALTAKLNAKGIHTVLELAQYGQEAAKRDFSVVLARTVQELNGEAVLPWEDDNVVNQQIIASRSLGEKIYDKDTLYASIVHHVGRGVHKLREQGAVARSISVNIRTNAFSSVDPQYANTSTGQLPSPSDDLATFAKLAREAFESIWREGFPYTKSGITINEIIPKDQVQNDLFAIAEENTQSEAVMKALESINSKFGRGAAVVASQRQGGDWQPKAENRSPEYTTQWADIPVVKA